MANFKPPFVWKKSNKDYENTVKIQNSPAVKSVQSQKGHCEKGVKSKVAAKKLLW